MKTKLTMLFLFAAATLAFGDDGKLNVGDEVSFDAIAAADWIQGEAPKDWEEDKLYVLECWATWCGPCLRVIPKVNALHKKYEEKGLRIIGMHVFERGNNAREKIVKFVENKGDGMSYPVAFAKRGGKFHKDWLQAAGVRGIPHAFLVKNGKLLARMHPARLTEDLVEKLLKDDKESEKLLNEMAEAAANQGKLRALQREWAAAHRSQDADAMATIIKKMEELNAKHSMLPQMKMEHAIVSKEWEKAEKMASDLVGKPAGSRTFYSLAYRIVPGGIPVMATRSAPDGKDYPESFKKAIADGFAKALSGKTSPTGLVVLASIQYDLGDKEAAKASAELAAKNHGRMPVAPFEAFLTSIEDRKPQQPKEVFAALREARTKR